MRFEEKEVFPLAVDILKAEQWNEIEVKFVSGEDPLFSHKSRALYDNLYDALMGEGGKLQG